MIYETIAYFKSLILQIYTVIILPNLDWILFFCFFVGFFIIKDFISDGIKKWIGKIS